MKNKKVVIIAGIVIVVAIVLVVVFGSKGNNNNKKTTGSGTSTSTSTSKEEQKEEKKAEELSMGGTMENDYVKMTLEKFEVEPEYKFSYTEKTRVGTSTKNNGIDGKSGMKLVCLRGKLTNKTSKQIYPTNNPVQGEMIINSNTYKTTLKCFDTEHAESYLTMVAQQEAEYFLYAEVPDSVADNIESCIIKFGCVKDLDPSKYIPTMNDLDFLYSLQAK